MTVKLTSRLLSDVGAELIRPRLLDLFCGAGGCSVGYHRAGFDVVGVDHKPQPRYPFTFIQADALETLKSIGDRFDAIHASPPCQAYTALRGLGKGAGDGAADLVEATRRLLIQAGRPWVIENVVGAPLERPTMLCGSMFGLRVRRHRLFECSFLLLAEPCQHHRNRKPIAVYGDHPQQPGDRTYRVNRARTLGEGQDAMGIGWMDWKTLTQAIPPAYTQYIGNQLIDLTRPLCGRS